MNEVEKLRGLLKECLPALKAERKEYLAAVTRGMNAYALLRPPFRGKGLLERVKDEL